MIDTVIEQICSMYDSISLDEAKMLPEFRRSIVDTLISRVKEPRRFIQVVTGPRQTGKTTAVKQMMSSVDLPTHFARASQDAVPSTNWLRGEWEQARLLCERGKALLVIDEIQMVSQWSGSVKALWDEDADEGTDLQVVLTGPSSLLLKKGLVESLTGRFEVIECPQWYFGECRDAFGLSLEEYLYFGGYPGAIALINDKNRWLDYVKNSIIDPSVLKDAISLERVTKPALMEALFQLGCSYSSQEISYRKLLGQLDDAGNATTIAHYLSLLSDAGLLTGLQKYSEKLVKTRSSSPRLMVHDTSLLVANYGMYREYLLTDPERKGHLVESAVGAYLLKRSKKDHFDVFWWREGDKEVDFVIQSGRARTAIEVKSGRVKSLKGLDAFSTLFPKTKTLVVGSSLCPLEDFLGGNVPLF